MRRIYVKCSDCDLRLSKNKTMYISDLNGKRVKCFHPCEGDTIWEVIRPELNWLQKKVTDSPFGLFEFINIKQKLNLLQKLLGFKDIPKLTNERTGILTNVICFDCCNRFNIDMDRDNLVCPSCQSQNVKSASKIDNEECPKCHSGVLQEYISRIIT